MKTSVYIDEEADAGLARRAAAEGISKAEVIRRALHEAANGDPVTPFTAIGVFQGPDDLAREAEAYLDRAGLGSGDRRPFAAPTPAGRRRS